MLSDRVGDALAAADEPWTVYVIEVRQVPATPDHAAVLGLDVGDTLAERHYQVAGAHSKQPWAIGLSAQPLDGVAAPARKVLLGERMIDDDDLELAYGRRIVG